ncbi:MAG: glycosyltransferase family 2 protein [Thermoleophilia bacterium]|nr:glycosyltransferase family 2 protein [Thermoleophilia bacterium]
MTLVDVVVVSFNSRDHLRDCLTRLAGVSDVRVIVVDNASTDGTLETVADLPVTTIGREVNAGFAAGCNAGWQTGDAPYVLFLNPDASFDETSLRLLVSRLEENPSLGAAAPRIEHPDGSLAWSQRRFPRLRSTFAQALFLHRVFPHASWSDEMVRHEARYEGAGSPEWVSGSCLLVRRSALEELSGWDEGFFLYCEDIDLCYRLREAGYGIAYEPTALARHDEGASAPRAKTLPVLAASRVRYARKHRSAPYAALERIGIGLGALTHVVVSRGGLADRAAHARALRVALSPRIGT